MFHIMNPWYNKQISPVPWHFIKSRLYCRALEWGHVITVTTFCRLRAVPLQSVESKLGRTGESKMFFTFACFARFPRSCDHPEGLLMHSISSLAWPSWGTARNLLRLMCGTLNSMDKNSTKLQNPGEIILQQVVRAEIIPPACKLCAFLSSSPLLELAHAV